MSKQATIYRMVTPDHLCPWGIKAYDLLKRNGFQIDDHHLKSQDENKQYKQENGYDETPQIFIGGQHLGGYDQLREHLGMGPDPKEGDTYQPIIALFAVTLGMALTTTWAITASIIAPLKSSPVNSSMVCSPPGLMTLNSINQGKARSIPANSTP